LKLCGAYQLLIYADDVNILGGSTDVSIVANKELRLEVNTDKTEYMILSREKK
jgi:hypothetical protein